MSHSKLQKRGAGKRQTGRRLPSPAPSSALSAECIEPALSPALVDRILRHNRSLLLGKITAAVAHEIINPIAASLNLATLMQHILKEDGIPAERAEDCRNYLFQIVRETGRAGKIASDILSFARTADSPPCLADLNEIVRQAFSLAAHLFKTEDVECRLELTEGLPRISCDTIRIRQALLNVLVNAVEAVEGSDSRLVTIETREAEGGGAVLLEVRDTGEGIAPGILQDVFEPFFSTRTDAENLGLGLTVARRIVQEHQGSLEVHAGPSQGAAVRFTLPVPTA